MKITIINDDKKDILYHTFSSSSSVISASLDEEINKTSILSLEIIDMTIKIEEFKTQVEVEDLNTQSVIFRGRIVGLSESMDSDGLFTRSIVAEDYLSYLNDVYTRPMYYSNLSYRECLNNILWQYNKEKRNVVGFNVGICEFEGTMVHETKYESCLSAVNSLLSILNAEIDYRYSKEANIVYIDLLKRRGKNKGFSVALSQNMISIDKSNDLSIITRIIPIGKSENDKTLTISSINDGKDYIEDTEAVKKYGIIEGTAENADITDKNTLLQWGKSKLKELSIPKLSINLDLLDLSLLAGSKIPKLSIGDGMNVYNGVLNINQTIRCIKKKTNLFEKHNPSVTLSSRKRRLSDKLIEVQNKLSQGNKSYVASSEIRFSDNIDTVNPLKEEVEIIGNVVSASLKIKISKYKFTTDNGIQLKDYPEYVKVIVNGNETTYITDIVSDIEEIVDLKEVIKDGKNTIKISCDSYAKIDCILNIKLFN